MQHIRNFSIIAHIDHGKSTLADRIIQLCGGLSDREMEAQVLDSMDLERERGITIKAQTAALSYKARDGQVYNLNLIDTPGHVDFSYEVSRSLSACEGALLVVDASQGVEAQTVANCYTALDLGVEVVPVLNKIDLPSANPDNAIEEIEEVIGIDAHDAVRCSAKTGEGVQDVLEAMIARVPPPKGDPGRAVAGADHRFLVRQLRGRSDAGAGDERHAQAQGQDPVHGHWRAASDRKRRRVHAQVTATRKPGRRTGRLCHRRHQGTQGGQGRRYHHPSGERPRSNRCQDSRKCSPRCSPDCFRSNPTNTKRCATRWRNSNSTMLRCVMSRRFRRRWASVFAAVSSACCTWRSCRSAWRREFGMDLITTAPTVIYEVVQRDGKVLVVDNPSKMPDPSKIAEIREPIVTVNLYMPLEYVGAVITLCTQKRGTQINISYHGKQVKLVYEMPMAEIVMDFFDKLKSISRGYASMDYEFKEYRAADVVKVDMLINSEKVDALSVIVHRASSQHRGREVAAKMRELIPRQMYDVAIQATIGSNIIARENVKAMRKNVLAKCYGGDISRKKKLLEKQKAGKKRMKQVGSVEIPQEAFLAILRVDD